MKQQLQRHKYLYIVIGIVLLSLIVLGIASLMSGSDKQVDEVSKTLTPSNDTALIADFFLEVLEPSEVDIVVRKSPITIKGRTRLDALVTVNDYVVEPDIQGHFQQAIDLAPGLNIIDIIASISSGEQESVVLGVGYFPE
jgi:hypothetical protein